jgi:hypothetical protein
VLVGALDAYGVSRQPLQTALYEAAEAARAKKIDATAELIEGSPGESILAAAIKHDADLIVVGNRGMGQATRFRLGSVPDWVAHDAPCDLLIVEGFKFAPIPKLEVWRAATGEPLLHPNDPHIVAVATDSPVQTKLPLLDLNDDATIAAFIVSHLKLHE